MSEWLLATRHGQLPDGRTLVAVAEAPKLEDGQEYLVRIRRPRNPRQHRLYWAMVRGMVDAGADPRWQSPEALHRWLKFQMGRYHLVAVDNGKVIVEWDSTDFGAMDQGAFADFFERAVAILCMEIGADPLAFTQEQ